MKIQKREALEVLVVVFAIFGFFGMVRSCSSMARWVRHDHRHDVAPEGSCGHPSHDSKAASDQAREPFQKSP